MAWQEKIYHLKSTCPMIMHNGQGVDPLNKFSKALKLISGKRGKTEKDYEEMALIEFQSALYMGADGPIIPQPNLEATLIAASKRFREGNLAKSGMFVKGDSTLVYDGSKDPKEMFNDDTMRDTRAVAIQRAKVMRTRPIFHKWEADITVAFEDTVVNAARVDEWMITAGTVIGLCEMRPRMGRFEVS